MDVTLLAHNKQLVGAYLENGILLDARPGIGEALKETGITPKTVLLTSMSGEAIAGLDELNGLPIGKTDGISDCEVEQFPVGAKGNRRYGFSLKTSDGKFVYAPEFDRISKSHLEGAQYALLDAGDRSEVGEPSGLSHRAFKARELMVKGLKISGIYRDEVQETKVYTLVKETQKETTIAKIVSKSVDLEEEIRKIVRAFEEFEFMHPVATDRMYVIKTYDDSVIVVYYEDYDNRKYFRISYTRSGDSFTFAEVTSWEKVVPQTSYVTTKSHITVKEQDGKRRWIAISSSDFWDADKERVSTQAMDFAIAVSKQRGNAGNLVWEHYDELPIGLCEKQTRVGRFLVEEGPFYETAFAQKAADRLETARPGEYRISIGFKYWEGTQSDDGTFHFIDIFHRASTTHPSNPTTSVEVVKEMSNKKLTPEAIKTIQADLGLSDADMEAVLKAAYKEETPAEGDNTRHKTEEKPVEKPVETPAETKPTDLEALTARMAAIEAENVALKAKLDEKPNVDEIVRNSLKSILSGQPKGDITRTSQNGAELTEDEKTKLANEAAKSAEPTVWETYYKQFNATVKA